jgi:hypothetical protein
MSRNFLLVCLCASACGSGQQVPYQELVLKGDAIAHQIQVKLEGTRVEFHCDGVGADGKAKAGCFIQLGSGMGDRRFEFSLPNRVVDLGYGGEIVYKVSDVKLDAVRVSTSGGEFVIDAGFLSKTVALKGEHSLLGDAAVPDIKLDNMRLVVRLKPIVTQAGLISYDSPKVEFSATVDNTFIPRFTLLGNTIDVVDAVSNYRRQLCLSIQSQIQKALADPQRKAALAQKLQDGIAGQIAGPSSPVLGIHFQGADLVVKLRK